MSALLNLWDMAGAVGVKSVVYLIHIFPLTLLLFITDVDYVSSDKLLEFFYNLFILVLNLYTIFTLALIVPF